MITSNLSCSKKQLNLFKQNGLVLFLALIALVAMSLAAAALIRSVDTNALIAGNLAFKQTATIAADNGIEAAIEWINNNPNALEANAAASGYYATSTGAGLPNANIVQTANWTDANSRLATGFGIDASGRDNAGNVIRFIVQRMCSNTGAASEENCLFGVGESNTSSSTVKPAPEQGANLVDSTSPMYRVTAQVQGPKNTISYVQAYIF